MDTNRLVRYSQASTHTELAPSSGPRGATLTPTEHGMAGNLRDHLSIIFKHKYKILICFLISTLVAPLAYYLLPKFRPPLYEARATLMLKSGREYSGPELGTNKTPISFGRGEIFNSEIMMLKSRDLKERLISTFGHGTLYPAMAAHPPAHISLQEAVLLALDKDLAVREVRNSNFLEVACVNSQPEIASRVVNQLIDFYREKRRELLSDPKTSFFLEKKLAEYRQKLRESEERLESFRRNYGFYSFEKQMDYFLAQRSQIEGSIKGVQDEIQTLTQRSTILNNQLKSVPQVLTNFAIEPEQTAATDTEGSKELRSKLLALQQKEQDLLGKYTESNYFVVNVRREIQNVKDMIKKEETERSRKSQVNVGQPQGSSVFQSLEQEKNLNEANIKASEAKLEGHKQELGELDKQIRELGSQEKKLKELHRELEHNEKYYQTYAGKLEEVKIGDDINRQEMASVSVVQAAVPPPRPMNELLGIIPFMLIAGFIGLGGGVGIAYLLEFKAQGLRTPEAVENRLGIPVLVTIPFRK